MVVRQEYHLRTTYVSGIAYDVAQTAALSLLYYKMKKVSFEIENFIETHTLYFEVPGIN